MEATENSIKPIGLQAVNVAIDHGASLTDLMNDINCLLESAMDSLDGMSDAASVTDGSVPGEIHAHWWPMIYTLRQAKAAFDRAYDLAHETKTVSTKLEVRHG